MTAAKPRLPGAQRPCTAPCMAPLHAPGVPLAHPSRKALPPNSTSRISRYSSVRPRLRLTQIGSLRSLTGGGAEGGAGRGSGPGGRGQG